MSPYTGLRNGHVGLATGTHRALIVITLDLSVIWGQILATTDVSPIGPGLPTTFCLMLESRGFPICTPFNPLKVELFHPHGGSPLPLDGDVGVAVSRCCTAKRTKRGGEDQAKIFRGEDHA
jgi:hypothetical protein